MNMGMVKMLAGENGMIRLAASVPRLAVRDGERKRDCCALDSLC